MAMVVRANPVMCLSADRYHIILTVDGVLEVDKAILARLYLALRCVHLGAKPLEFGIFLYHVQPPFRWAFVRDK